MNPTPRKDDKRPVIRASSQSPHIQRPVEQSLRFQSPVPQVPNSNQASASSSRFSSPSSQSTSSTRIYNPPPIASPLPKEFRDRWRVVNTSSGSNVSSLDRTASIESSSLYSSPSLKRKYQAVSKTGNSNNISRVWSAVSTSHAQPAPIAPGPGSANRIASNPPQLPIRRELTTKSPSTPTSPLSAPSLVPKPISAPYQLTINSKDKIYPSSTHLNTQLATFSGATHQTPPRPQEPNTFQPKTSKRSGSRSVSNKNRNGLVDGALEPLSLKSRNKDAMPLWPLPQDEYQPEAPAVPEDTPAQHLRPGKVEPSGLTERRHSEDEPQARDGHSDYESECFEDYDPFDDVPELREALEKRDKTRIESRLPISSNSQYNPPKEFFKIKPSESRLPYLSSNTRSYFRDGNIPYLDSMIDRQLHVPFSEQEARTVWHTAYIICPSLAKELLFLEEKFSVGVGIKALAAFLESSEFSRSEKHETLVSIASEATLDLPRRKEEDVQRYMIEAIQARNPTSRSQDIVIVSKDRPDSGTSWSSLILSRQCTEGMWTRRHLTSHAHVQSIGSRKALRFLRPFRTFTEGSSDVVDCAWDFSGWNFALACTTYNDMYNRVGNLMLGSVDGPIKFLCGHKTRRPPNQGNTAILDPYLHSTVSSVDFSGDLLFSSGFDNTVKIWDKNNKLLQRSLLFGSPVVRMKMSGLFQNTGTVCLQDGGVVIFRSCLHSVDEPDSRHVISARHDFLEPASVLWVNGTAGRKGWVFVGYENKESDKRQPNASLGDLRLFDAKHGQEVQEIRPGSTRQFDINLDDSGSFLITGSIVNAARRPTPDTHSFVRVYDIEQSPRKMLEFSCQHKDINKVTMSPCRRYVTSSGTNGKSYLWDIRRGGDPLHEFGHGESRTPLSPDRDREEVDTGVTFASWVADGSLFVTGSSDGIVKVWDPARADPFLYNLATFDDPVMTGAFSPDGDCLMIGETTGKATLLSYMGRHGPPEPFVQDRTMLAPIASEG
ncbi:hypothetical protein TWF788_008494 [Orbilia oligospora]|uniref:Uncharacterized protein n=1 Tax=Orbilia oligospora TaxID=2813651 RepID=A0A7C8KXR1_ORBOL|nr:hypothetical protein TWF788_008494 [Orbilia oligospora]